MPESAIAALSSVDVPRHASLLYAVWLRTRLALTNSYFAFCTNYFCTVPKLGYTERNYTQQLYIEIGNHNHALIPDFVLLPNRSTGHASAFAIVEAKKTIPNEKFLEETKTQARSYANLLKTRYSVIAAKEKVWVTSGKDDYPKTIFEATWAELNNPDTFYQLEKMIGFH